ncbi:MAG: hypothetical protein AAF623_09070 [Planctomycetota bacterium]
MHKDYKDKVNFFFVYKSLAHPEINGYVQPFNLKERLKHIEVAKERLQTEIPWLCDPISNEVNQAFGYPPNGEFILDPDGVIVRKRFWSNADTLRNDLEYLVGKSETTTPVQDVVRVMKPGKQREIPTNVVPKLRLPAGLAAFHVVPIDDENPFFAKLRVEGTRSMVSGNGQLYLGVYLDPIYDVHWNNRAGKVSVELECEGVLALEKTSFESDDIKEDADADPRQFLTTGKILEKGEVFLATVTYTVCDDAETFCQTFQQQYEVHARPERTQGTRPGIFLNSMFLDLRELDKNKDGNITTDEMPDGERTLYLGHIDYDDSGVLESGEIELFLSMFENGNGITAPNDGSGFKFSDLFGSRKKSPDGKENQNSEDSERTQID